MDHSKRSPLVWVMLIAAGVIAVGLILMVALVAFTGQGPTAGSQLAGGLSTPAQSLTPAPPATGELNLAFPFGEPETLDPAVAIDMSSKRVIMEVFSGLVTITPDLQIKPDLAESWTVSADQKTYTFKLKPDAQFANGKPITAQDFKYSFERAADPSTHSPSVLAHLGDIVGVKDKFAGRANEISGVRVLDDHDLQITIDAPKSFFLARLATVTAFVVDRENVEMGGPQWYSQPNGSGPYRLAGGYSGGSINLESNDRYNGTPKPSVKTIYWQLGPMHGPSYVDDYYQNMLDSAYVMQREVPAAFNPKGAFPGQGTAVALMGVFYLGLNMQAPPFDDPKVRQAFALAIDKKAIVDQFPAGAIPATGIYPPGFPGFNPNLKGLDYDPAKARELLQASRYGGAQNLPKLTLDVLESDTTSEAITQMLRRNLGVAITVRQDTDQSYWSALARRPLPFQMFESWRQAEYPDPVFLEESFYPSAPDNLTGYSNAQVDRLLEQARGERDPAQRIRLYQQAEQQVVNDAPWIPLFVLRDYWLTKPYVAGLIYPPLIMSHLKYITQGEPISAAQARLTPDRSAALPSTPIPHRTIKLDLATRDLVYDPLNDRIYASAPAGASGQGNALVTIDPHTGKVGDSIPIGSNPGKLALSGDGKLLYVALDGAGGIRPFDVTTGKPGLQFSLGNDSTLGSYVVSDMQVLPGNPDAVAISRRFVNLSPGNAGVAIYDKGIKRSKEVPAGGGPTALAFSDSADVLYGYNQLLSSFDFYTMTVAADGVTIKNQKMRLLSGFTTEIVYQDGLIYSGDGRVIDPQRLELVGTYPAEGLIRPDSRTHRVFFLTDHGTVLRVMDRDTYLPLAAWAIPDVLGTPSSFIRLGTYGLAFRTDQGQVFIIQTPN